MRSSLSCAFCRKSKIKCVNSGKAPCRKCAKSGLEGCSLTRPSPYKQKERRQLLRVASDGQRNGNQRSTLEEQVQPNPQAGHNPRSLPESDDYNQQYDKRTVDHHISSLPTNIILKCLNIFNNKFPELGILHMPSVIRELQCSRSEQTKALLGAVLVVTKPHGMIFNPAWVEGLLDADTYAIYTREMLSGLVLEPPSIQVVQALLILTLHEWGSRNFHKAWIYCGIAIRIMQAIHSLRVTRYPLDTEANTRNDVMSVAIENRVFWACFIMDRMVSSGTYNPPVLPMSEMEKLGILRPLSTVEFAFGTDLASHSLGIEESLMRSEHHPTGLLDITQSFEILVSGFDIWAQVMTFILNDGRRAPGMCAPQNCPWAPGSPWSRTRSQLQRWRASQHDRLYYPNNSVVAHMSLGYGESFTYSNLLYYVSTLMLHREYFPFLPLNEAGPRGPIDHPTLEAEAPPGWWEESARELFGATEQIALLLHEASECGVSLYTPFIGFCAFSAAYMNIYVHRFPQMNLDRSLRAEEGLNYCLVYLSEFRKVCKLGDGWLTTINHSSLLYERAASDRHRYQGKTRADFDILHQSIHEFRVVDRSNDYIQEIEGAERATGQDGHHPPCHPREPRINHVDVEMPLGQLLVEASNFAHDQGAWGHWWPSLEEVDLALGLEGAYTRTDLINDL